MSPVRPSRVLKSVLLVERYRPFIEMDDAELHRHAFSDPFERMLHQAVRDALALPFRGDDQPVDLSAEASA